ncbi:MAG: RNA polymerase sigma factor [Chloroflexota bacterium]
MAEGTLTRTGTTTPRTGAVAEQARRQDEAVFTAAYQAYYGKLFAFAYSRTRDAELAKDIVSGVFEKAYVKGHEVRQPAAYGAWLFMIAKNLIAGHYRRVGREQNHMGRAGEELRFVDPPPGPEDSLLRDERVGTLVRFLKGLSARDQELISLKFDAELSNGEIAGIVGMTQLNVRVAIFRALRRLRNKMQEHDA